MIAIFHPANTSVLRPYSRASAGESLGKQKADTAAVGATVDRDDSELNRRWWLYSLRWYEYPRTIAAAEYTATVTPLANKNGRAANWTNEGGGASLPFTRFFCTGEVPLLFFLLLLVTVRQLCRLVSPVTPRQRLSRAAKLLRLLLREPTPELDARGAKLLDLLDRELAPVDDLLFSAS